MNVNPEQRQHSRHQILDFTSITVPGSSIPIPALLVNIGLGGAQVRSHHSLPANGRVLLCVCGVDGEPLEVNSEIRRTTQIEGTKLYEAGVRFTPESHSERMALASFVHEVFQRHSESIAS